jgi:hypothetical protein
MRIETRVKNLEKAVAGRLGRGNLVAFDWEEEGNRILSIPTMNYYGSAEDGYKLLGKLNPSGLVVLKGENCLKD